MCISTEQRKKTNMKVFEFLSLLSLCCFNPASGATHSLQYFYTASTGIRSFPDFVAVGMVDGTEFYQYDSKSKRGVPKQDWKIEDDPEYWERETAASTRLSQNFKVSIDTAMSRFNQTGGVHVFQQYYGCEWDDVTGTTKGFSLEGYDGEDLISLDLENLRYIAAVSQALPTKYKWETNRSLLEYDKQYFSSECIDWLKKYVAYGSSTLGRKVPPKVSVFQKDSSSSAVVCHATGFYPQGVMITWKRDGEEMTDDIDVGETLPNADGNFQKRAVLYVQLEDRKSSKYTCEVTHSSGEPITMILNEDELKRSNPDSVPLGPIIGVVVGLLVVIAVIAGFVVLRNKKKSGFARANTDESSQVIKSSSEKAQGLKPLSGMWRKYTIVDRFFQLCKEKLLTVPLENKKTASTPVR